MVKNSFAAMLLESASQDVLAYKSLCLTPGVGDALVGFHAQQAVEKSMPWNCGMDWLSLGNRIASP